MEEEAPTPERLVVGAFVVIRESIAVGANDAERAVTFTDDMAKRKGVVGVVTHAGTDGVCCVRFGTDDDEHELLAEWLSMYHGVVDPEMVRPVGGLQQLRALGNRDAFFTLHREVELHRLRIPEGQRKTWLARRRESEWLRSRK